MKKNRKTMLFVPGNKPSLFKDVISYEMDTVMFDLEDSISIEEKDAARELTKNMINFFNYNKYNIEVCVRINHFDTPFYQNDLKEIVGLSKTNLIRLPKIETKEEIQKVIEDIEKIEKKTNKKDQIKIFCALESAKGILNAFQIANSSPRITGIALGGIDYLLDLNASKTNEGNELLFARHMIVHAARSAKIDAFDCIYNNINDNEGLRKEAEFVKKLGFSGKSAIHPNQLEIINEIFKPSQEEIEESLKILTIYSEHIKNNKNGVFSINGKMIDKPVLQNAENILSKANIKKPF
ncbi:MAG: citrate lyase subunit beta / citryl-CoA lyase [Candidatus Phytoplasma cynodontis]|uniref:HpcH/HpaI aldolase/citrate lyase family protein n=1 Tax='Cynodon dactylon' phytoplasma TaxID=295320 RepID=UPI001265AFA4|nr:aldolase/citrate lyase family protein ['Cynodon dactylon' phytoplasma]KAB8122027.1 citrate lyase subunit beta ['Cynodon dactylon' phytoplasma]WIA07556.1 MAG: citrate lyase subunit beta / citryl-CoA lyase [Candidatus Phytoplasma cynodontis]